MKSAFHFLVASLAHKDFEFIFSYSFLAYKLLGLFFAYSFLTNIDILQPI